MGPTAKLPKHGSWFHYLLVLCPLMNHILGLYEFTSIKLVQYNITYFIRAVIRMKHTKLLEQLHTYNKCSKISTLCVFTYTDIFYFQYDTLK